MAVNGAAALAAAAALASSALTGSVTYLITRRQVNASMQLADGQRDYEREMARQEKIREEREERLNRFLLVFTAAKSSDLLSQSIYRAMSESEGQIGPIDYYKYTAPAWEQFQRAWAEMLVCGSSEGLLASTNLMIKMERMTLAAEDGEPIEEELLPDFREAIKGLLRVAHAELDHAPARIRQEDIEQVFRILDEAADVGDSLEAIKRRGWKVEARRVDGPPPGAVVEESS